MPLLSIIVPHFGNTDQLEETLVSVLQNRPAGCEVLLVHPGTYDDPYGLAGEIRLVQVPAESTVIEGLNQALQAAEGQVIHIASSGVEAVEFWTQPALLHFDDPLVAAVTPLVLRRDNPQVVEFAGVRLNRWGERRLAGRGTKNRLAKVAKIKPRGPSLVAAFYRRQALERIGWLTTDLAAELVDVDTALALQQAGYRCVLEPESEMRIVRQERTTDEAPFSLARSSERLLWRQAPALAGRKTLAARLAIVPARLLLGLLRPMACKQTLGRIAAWLEIGRHRRYWRVLARIRAEQTHSSHAAGDTSLLVSSHEKTAGGLPPQDVETIYKRAS